MANGSFASFSVCFARLKQRFKLALKLLRCKLAGHGGVLVV
jgi:hypothetical protein